MLRRISKLGFFIQFLLFLAVASLFWLPAIMDPGPPMHIPSEGPLYTLLSQWLTGMPVFSVCFALLMVLVMCIFLYAICSSNDLVTRENFLPAILYMVLLSWNASLLVLHPLLPAGILAMISVYTLMRMYGQQDPYRQVFTATACIAVASLFYMPAMYLLFMVWFSFLSYRISGWREWLITLIGFLFPFIYLASWYFWNDEFLSGMLKVLDAIDDPGIGVNNLKAPDIFWLLASALVLLTTMFAVINAIQDKLINLRRKTFILINFSFASLIMISLSGSPVLFSHQMFFLPLAFFMTAILNFVKKGLFYEIILILYLSSLVLIRLFA